MKELSVSWPLFFLFSPPPPGCLPGSLLSGHETVFYVISPSSQLKRDGGKVGVRKRVFHDWMSPRHRRSDKRGRKVVDTLQECVNGRQKFLLFTPARVRKWKSSFTTRVVMFDQTLNNAPNKIPLDDHKERKTIFYCFLHRGRTCGARYVKFTTTAGRVGVCFFRFHRRMREECATLVMTIFPLLFHMTVSRYGTYSFTITRGLA